MSTTANQVGIKLKASVCDIKDLDLLHSVQGKEQCYFNMLVNFLCRALRSTSRDGEVQVHIGITEKQSVQSINSQENNEMLGAIDVQKYYINLSISVIDSGIGFQVDSNSLFIDLDDFNQDVNRMVDQNKLGISLSKNIIEKLGGSLKVTSTE